MHLFFIPLSINSIYHFNIYKKMRKIINIHSSYFNNKEEERLQSAKHNSLVFTAEELLDNFLNTIILGDEEVYKIYKNAIINRMKDSEILYSLLDN